MGKLLSSKQLYPVSRYMIQRLKKNDLGNIDECLMILNDEYPDHVCLTFDEFKDVFNEMLEPNTK